MSNWIRCAGWLMMAFLGVLTGKSALAVDIQNLLAATPGGSTASDSAQVSGDTIVANDFSEGFRVAHQDLMNDNLDGVRTVIVGSGTGFLSTGSAVYNTYDNKNATLLSKKAAYNRAALTAKRGLIAYFGEPTIACENIVESVMKSIDTGSESGYNMSDISSEECEEAVQGSLNGFVTFDVYDDVNSNEVRVSLISTERTRAAIGTNIGGHLSGADLQVMFNSVMDDLRSGVLPPMGGKIIQVPDSNEMVIVGFGSAINRQHDNSNIQRRLEKAADRQSRMRANAALLGIMNGEEVYHRGSFDEAQIEVTEEFMQDPEIEGAEGLLKLENSRNQFLNLTRENEAFETVVDGTLPQGVVNRSIKSDDGYWTYSLAIFSPSLSRTARGAAQEYSGEPPQKPAGRELKRNGFNENATNPQGPSGSVSDGDAL